METRPDKWKWPSVTSLIAFMMIVVGGYVFSPGLLVLLENAGYLGDDNALATVIGVIYWPLQWCFDNFGWVESFYEAYFEILGVE